MDKADVGERFLVASLCVRYRLLHQLHSYLLSCIQGHPIWHNGMFMSSRYSWNSLTRSRWDQRKYFELSEVRVKHQLWTKLFFSIGVGFSTFRVMVYISYDVDTLYSWFGAFWRMLEHEINNNYETLFIYYNNYSRNTTKLTSTLSNRIHHYMFWIEQEVNKQINRLNQGITCRNVSN